MEDKRRQKRQVSLQFPCSKGLDFPKNGICALMCNELEVSGGLPTINTVAT